MAEANKWMIDPNDAVVLLNELRFLGRSGEDCADLSVYGFDKKTSYVRVFRTEREGFVWIRNSDAFRQRSGSCTPGADATDAAVTHG
jgi:hypothetical protein